MKKYIIGSIVLCLCVGALYLWKGNGGDQTKRNASGSALVIRPAALERGRLNVDVSATGVINPINVVEVKSKASGLVEKIPIEASDVVQSGQLIARLDQTDTRNALEQAIADSQVASAVLIQQENNWRRAKDLFEKNLLAQSEYDQINVEYVRAKATLVKSQSNLVLARQKMAETTVRSPIDGIVLSRTVSEGQIVASAVSNAGGGTTIARLAAMDRVYLTAAVDEVDIGKIRVGQRGRIVADAYPGDVFFGEVVRVAAQSTVIQNVTTFDVILLVPNRGNKLKAGMNATVTVDIAGKDDALLIGNDLLRTYAEVQADKKILEEAGVVLPEKRGDRTQDSSGRGMGRKRMREQNSGSDSTRLRFVVLSEAGTLRAHPVRIGLSNADVSEVLSGLDDSSRVMLVVYSQALKESERFKDRMKERTSFSR